MREAAIPAPVKRETGNTSNDFKMYILANPIGIENGRDEIHMALVFCWKF